MQPFCLGKNVSWLKHWDVWKSRETGRELKKKHLKIAACFQSGASVQLHLLGFGLPLRLTNSLLTHFWALHRYLQAILASILALLSAAQTLLGCNCQAQCGAPASGATWEEDVWDPGARGRGAFMQPCLRFTQTSRRRVKSSYNQCQHHRVLFPAQESG